MIKMLHDCIKNGKNSKRKKKILWIFLYICFFGVFLCIAVYVFKFLSTGSSSGIGRGAAVKFAALGAKLALTGRQTAYLEEVGKECEQISGYKVKRNVSIYLFLGRDQLFIPMHAYKSICAVYTLLFYTLGPYCSLK